ncbi:hypothetical protein B7463_g4123, partial [Scytalidium lignicola]
MEQDPKTIQFSPAIPLPIVFDVEERVKKLYSYLDPKERNYQPIKQHHNIQAAIKLYEEGKIDGSNPVFIMDGKLSSWEEVIQKRHQAWTEGTFKQ